MEEESLATAFSDSLTEEVSGCVGEFLEIGIDSLLEDGLTKDIPFLSTISSVYKIGNTIRERHHLKKLAVFLNEINRRVADEEKRQTYRKKFTSQKEHRNSELEYVTIVLDHYIDFDKPEMLAKLYLAYLDGFIDWNEFKKYAEIIDRFLPGDYAELKKKNRIALDDMNVSDSLLRLISLGFITKVPPVMQAPTTLGSIRIVPPTSNDYLVSRFEKKFLTIMEEPL